MKIKQKLAAGFILCLLFLNACRQEEPAVLLEEGAFEEEEASSEEAKKSETPEVAERIWVDICGEVNNPGVYEMEQGQRLYELLEKAGGFTENAEAMSVNQARVLQDGEQITILSQADYEAAGGQAAAEGSSGKINLNTADAEELTELNGIGPSKAEAIIAYREEHGSFSDIEEIKEVDGIGDGTFEKIKEDIIV